MTRSAKCVFAPGNVVIHLEAGHRRIVRVMFFKMSIYARSGRLGRPRAIPRIPMLLHCPSENATHGSFEHFVDPLAVRAFFAGCEGAGPKLPVERRSVVCQCGGQSP